MCLEGTEVHAYEEKEAVSVVRMTSTASPAAEHARHPRNRRWRLPGCAIASCFPTHRQRTDGGGFEGDGRRLLRHVVPHTVLRQRLLARVRHRHPRHVIITGRTVLKSSSARYPHAHAAATTSLSSSSKRFAGSGVPPPSPEASCSAAREIRVVYSAFALGEWGMLLKAGRVSVGMAYNNYQHLESLLDSALATLALIQMATSPPIFTPHLLGVLHTSGYPEYTHKGYGRYHGPGQKCWPWARRRRGENLAHGTTHGHPSNPSGSKDQKGFISGIWAPFGLLKGLLQSLHPGLSACEVGATSEHIKFVLSAYWAACRSALVWAFGGRLGWYWAC
ncbi:hypothetical protein C8F04DRAFT_1198138 [Mycena alexandri]|uniref:Uncharacterized protein n=1 Tax=Mycena alexandri TaxID=1745969 RepID=A0AAD6S1E1_9AGAR|nr:hypothetical protein C8F04DRAFT_1198138 [Mycena alexandri]